VVRMSRCDRPWSGWRRPTSALALMIVALVAIASLAASGPARARSRRAPGALSRQVTITRDRAGVPHIVARTFTALGYGEGFAFAQDNLCTFAQDIVTVEGNRSRYFGPRGLANSYAAGVSTTNLQSDLFWRYVQASGLAQRLLHGRAPNALLPQVRQLYVGWIAGYNRYLRSGRLRDPACHGKPWVHPLTLTDMMLRGLQITSLPSSQQFIAGIDAAAPPHGTAALARAALARAVVARTAVARGAIAPSRAGLARLRAQFDAGNATDGSNGIGLGAQATRSHHGMVLANPHFPWRGTERFWMAQLDVPGQYDVEGGTLMGFPLIGIGFNRHLAWTHTNSTDMRFVAIQLKLAPGDPTSYIVNGRRYRMGRISVRVRAGARIVHHTFYTTRWGVVLTVPSAGYSWSASTAYALDDATMAGAARAADEYLEMGRSSSVHALYAAEARWLAIPVFNTMAADDTGTAYYGDVGATPAVSAAEIARCIPNGTPRFVYAAARVITLDGARSSCSPATIPGTPAPGLFPARDLPHMFRRDYVENSNNSFWLANPAHPLTGFSPIIGTVDAQQNGRTRLGNAMIAARITGTDGLSPAGFTIPTLQAMWESDRSELALLVLNDLISDCRAHPVQTASNGQTVDLTAGCAALSGWNGTSQLTATGGWLFKVWAALDTDRQFYATPFDPTRPLSTPSGLNTGPGATPLRWLADAVLNLQDHHIALDASWAAVQHAPQSRAIPVGGCPGEGAGQDMGCFNAIYSPDGTPATAGPLNGGPYGQVNDGSSLVLTTEVNPGGPISQGILTYSQATDPTSPWYQNMTRLYSQARWVPLAYTASQLRREHPLAAVRLTMP
jgi:acyl-homoserine-lactone acylase